MTIKRILFVALFSYLLAITSILMYVARIEGYEVPLFTSTAIAIFMTPTSRPYRPA